MRKMRILLYKKIGFFNIFSIYRKDKEYKNAKIIIYKNSIEATYGIKSGKEMPFLNPYDIALKKWRLYFRRNKIKFSSKSNLFKIAKSNINK